MVVLDRDRDRTRGMGTVKTRIPVLTTFLVILCVAGMVGLGIWQLARRHEKEAMIALYRANMARPPAAMAALWPVKDGDLYRRVSATCLRVTGWQEQAGRSAAGATGWRHVATCATGAEGPGIRADMGVSAAPGNPKGWTGGPVQGRLVWAPSGQPLVARLFTRPPPPTPMIVADRPAPGLARSADPDPAGIPNNHLAYAVQWFLFAGVATVIYAIALVRRGRR